MLENATSSIDKGFGDLDQKKLKIELSVHHPTTFHFQINLISIHSVKYPRSINLHLIIHPEMCRMSKIQSENFSEIFSILKPQFHFHHMLI